MTTTSATTATALFLSLLRMMIPAFLRKMIPTFFAAVTSNEFSPPFPATPVSKAPAPRGILREKNHVYREVSVTWSESLVSFEKSVPASDKSCPSPRKKLGWKTLREKYGIRRKYVPKLDDVSKRLFHTIDSAPSSNNGIESEEHGGEERIKRTTSTNTSTTTEELLYLSVLQRFIASTCKADTSDELAGTSDESSSDESSLLFPSTPITKSVSASDKSCPSPRKKLGWKTLREKYGIRRKHVPNLDDVSKPLFHTIDSAPSSNNTIESEHEKEQQPKNLVTVSLRRIDALEKKKQPLRRSPRIAAMKTVINYRGMA